MQNLESSKIVAETRIPKAPGSVTTAKTDKVQSPVYETKLPIIKPTTKSSKLQTTTSSPTSTRNTTALGTGTKLRRAISSLADSNTVKVNAPTSEIKLRRTKSTLTETKRPKSQILTTATKLPKLQNTSEAKSPKIGSMKLPQLEAVDTTRETKERKIKMTADSKLPRIQHLSLPLKEINTGVPVVELCKESLGNSNNIQALNLSTEQMVEPVKTHLTSLPPKVSKTTESDSSKILGAESKATHPKGSTPVTATKLPKALPVTNMISSKSPKIISSNAETSPIKSPTTAVVERKLPKAQLTLTGLKSPKYPESKLPKTPTTPDESKLPRALGSGVVANAAETRRQKQVIRR